MFVRCSHALVPLSALIISPVVGAAALTGRAGVGCGKPHTADGKTRSITINSTCCSNVTQTRNYNIHLPTNYNPNYPTALIISYHGAGETPSEHEKESQLSDVSYNPDMIVVYPEGVHVSLTLSHPQTGSMRPVGLQSQSHQITDNRYESASANGQSRNNGKVQRMPILE